MTPLKLVDQKTGGVFHVDQRLASHVLMAWAWLHICRTGETFDPEKITPWAMYEIAKYQDEQRPPPPLRIA